MEYQDNIDDLLTDALTLNTAQLNNEKIITSCTLPRDSECNDDLLRLSAQSIPIVYGVNSISITIPNLSITAMNSILSEKTKYLTMSIFSIDNDYLQKIKSTFNKAYPLISINVNKLHTLYAIHKLDSQRDNNEVRVRRSIYAELLGLTLNRMGCTTIDNPKMLYEFLTLISVPLDWVDIYNLIIKYKGINFLLFMLNSSTAKLFENNKDVQKTPLVLMRYVDSKTIDLINVFEKGSAIFTNII